jgi:hypothetical protein
MMSTSTAMEHLRALVLFDAGVECFAQRVVAGVKAAGAQARAASVRESGVGVLEHSDLLIVGAPAAALVGRDAETSRLGTGHAASPLRSWLRDVPQLMPSQTGRIGRPPCVAAFDVRVSRGRRHPSTASNVVSRTLARRGLELATVPTSFLIDATDLTPADRELARTERWGSGLATIAWAIHAGKRPSWWLQRSLATAPVPAA